MGNDLNIKSSTIEKGIELAKDFLDKLIMPAVEETGLLMKEKVTFWKFKNQVKILNKAKEYCDKHGIEPKTISFKLLVPLLETSALEEDEILQNKWAILLSNMVDSNQNIENHVFPYILGQLSTNEFLLLEKVVIERKERLKNLLLEYEEYKTNRPETERKIKEQISDLEEQMETESNGQKYFYSNKMWELRKEKSEFESQLRNLEHKEWSYKWNAQKPEEFPDGILREFEVSNLSRLGLVKYVQENISNSNTLEIPNRPNEEYLVVDFDIDVDYEERYLLTELGELLIDACSEKKTAPNKT
ncbi:Abi-alpha family protein [Arenibacter certesii]|uniref:DUF4393 domain-containing protein n=1 Tax=Arenibacter certesii TaxID=228955 RepID=A0A918J8X4_9FLAO|nr:Abi-alpha family protein [Arenibacter certesii]GGW50197.1 hypothetical protein GCM10007383_37580 [Arenibacter certesii]